MLVVRGVNVFPSEIESAVLEDPQLAGHYAIVVDRRTALPELEVRAEVADASVALDLAAEALRRRLAERLLLRVDVVMGAPGSIPRQELGKAQRVFERIDERDPLS
jgi:phenylacetate-CoA ligase